MAQQELSSSPPTGDERQGEVFFNVITGSFTQTDKKYHDTAAEQGFLECWVGS